LIERWQAAAALASNGGKPWPYAGTDAPTAAASITTAAGKRIDRAASGTRSWPVLSGTILAVKLTWW
jgi:hypothetical protein